MRNLLPFLTLFVWFFACENPHEIPEDYQKITDRTEQARDNFFKDWDKALELSKQNLKESKAKGYDYLTAKNYTYIAYIFDVQDKNKKAYVAYNDAINYWLKTDSISDQNIYTSYTGLGVICRQYKEYDQAILYYSKAYDYLKKLNNTKKESDLTYNLGVAYKLKGDKESIEKAEEYFTKSLELAKKSEYEVGVASVYFQIGKMYKSFEDYDIAEISYKECLSYSKSKHLEEFIEVAHQGLGEIEKAKGNYNSAIDHFEKALAINFDKDLILEVKRDLGEAYLSVGKTKDAIKVWESALAGEYNPNDPDVLDVYQNLSMAYQVSDNLDKALAYSEQYSNNLKDIIKSTEYVKGGYENILFREVIAEYDEFQHQKTLREQIRITYGPAALALLAIIFIGLGIFYYQRRIRRKTTAEKIKSFQVD